MFSTGFLILMSQCWILSTSGWIEIEIELRIGLKWFGDLSWESRPPLNCGSCPWIQIFGHPRWMKFWKDMIFLPDQVWSGHLDPSHSHILWRFAHTVTPWFWPILKPGSIPRPWSYHPRQIPRISGRKLPWIFRFRLQNLHVGEWGRSLQGLLDGKHIALLLLPTTNNGPILLQRSTNLMWKCLGDPMITNRIWKNV